MIKILDSNYVRLGAIKSTLSANRLEKINGENTLDYSATLSGTVLEFVNENTIYELDNDYFDTALFSKQTNDDGTFTVDVEAEHISYRLNNPEYNVDYFTEIGLPSYILGKVLEGTNFTVGTVEFSTSITYSAQEAKSRRQLLMELVAYVGGEVSFNKFEVSILAHRGSTEITSVVKDRNVKVISKTVNKRQKDKEGNDLVSYVCTPIFVPGDSYTLGDNIALLQKTIGLNEQLRVVSISRNPYDEMQTTFEFANYTNGLESSLFRIETSTIAKGKLYYGARISPENGFESIRSDLKARTVMNADTFAMQVGDGNGLWYNKLWFDPELNLYVFDGTLSADAINAIKAEIDVVVTNTTIVNNLTAQKGYIADLTVDELDTSDMVRNYVDENLATVGYIRIYDQHIDFMVAQVPDPLNVTNTPVFNRKGEALYWIDNTHTGVSVDATDPEGNPREQVKRYVYDGPDGLGISKLQLYFEAGGSFVPTMVWGAGNPAGKMKGYVYKDTEGMVVAYESSTGEMREIRLGEDGVFITPYDLEEIAFAAGGFSVKYSGQTYDWAWTKDGSGKITQLQTEDRTIPVTWP